MPLKVPPVQYDLVQLGGGLDQVTPTLSLKPGVLREAQNWECSITGGYTRVAGYERFDGRVSPSIATYSQITVNITASIVAGNIITGVSSGATAVVIAVNGSTLAITKYTGTFTVSEAVQVGGVTKGTVLSTTSSAYVDPATNATYLALAADVYRADIQAVPGSGPIRGVAYYQGSVYAWRNDAGGTLLNLYKSSATGWTAVALGYEVSFTAGLAAGIVDGNTVTGLTSGATGLVKRVVVQSGTFASNTAAGRLIFASITGTFSAGETLRVSGTARATCSGAQTAIAPIAGGRVETVVANFGSSSSSNRLYGADGRNRAFEFDGTTYVPIATGNTTDTPLHVMAHKNHLFLSFGPSVQNSAIADPYNWTTTAGAAEFGAGADVTGFLILPGDQTTGALAVYSDDTTQVLYGTSAQDFQLAAYNIGTGAKAYSAQNMATSYVFDNKGIVSLQTAFTYGNFDTASLTLNLRPFIQQRRNLVSASVVNREKSQYRVFFNDGYGLYMTVVNNKLMGTVPTQFPNPVLCCCDGETPDGAETSFFGSSNGYVYRLDTGTSFDGAVIDAYFLLTYNATKSPRIRKRYRKGSFEVTGESYATFSFSYTLGYGTSTIQPEAPAVYETNLSPSFWDSVSWDFFYWDGVTLSPSEVSIEGTAENIAVRITTNSAAYPPFTLNSLILHYTMRRGIR
jgi:hypothetical protein